MTTQLERPEMKTQTAKITEEDWAYFSLGIDKTEFILPSERADYKSDPRAVALVEAVKAGKDLSGQDFSGVNLKGADISGAKLQGANLQGAILYKTTANKCDFKGANFDGAYIEYFDGSGSDFRDASFKHVFVRNTNFKKAKIDEKELSKFAAIEQLIHLIESGQLDIRCLSKADLMHLDLRRIDLTNVDLEGVDLSGLILEGVNLCGTYIDPKQLMSLEGLQHYHQFVQKKKEQKLKLETLKVIQAKAKELDVYAAKQKLTKKTPDAPRKKLKRPPLKGKKDTETLILSLTEHVEFRHEQTHKISGHAPQPKKTNLKNRN